MKIRIFQEARRWHRWLGLGFLLPTLILGVTGILLNHKELFFGGAQSRPAVGLLSTTTNLGNLPFTPYAAMQRAHELWGEIPIEKLELKEEKGRLVYKIVAGPGRDLLLDAHTGSAQFVDGLQVRQEGGAGSKLDWKKFTGELHSGKIIGLTGRLLMDVAAAALVVLSATGLYLWALPYLQRRKS